MNPCHHRPQRKQKQQGISFLISCFYWEVQPGCPHQPQLQSSSQPMPLNPLGSAGLGLREQTRPVLQRWSTQTFPPSHSRTAAQPELPRTCQGRDRGNSGCATHTWTCTALNSFPESLLLPCQHWTFFPQTSSLRQIFGV